MAAKLGRSDLLKGSALKSLQKGYSGYSPNSEFTAQVILPSRVESPVGRRKNLFRGGIHAKATPQTGQPPRFRSRLLVGLGVW